MVDGPADKPSAAVAAAPAADPMVLMRSRQYRGLLLMAAIVGVVVSLASWCFLELVEHLQHWLYVDLPKDLGYHGLPWWWPLPPLTLAGFLLAVVIVRLPGHGGHEPSEGLATGAPTSPIDLPGVVLAAMVTLVLGLVLGPEAPLLALGSGVALSLVALVRRDVPIQARHVLAAAGTFAALATIFGSPVIGTVIIIEAAGLGGPMLPVLLLPGLIAAGIGSLLFVGLGSLSGVSSSAYALPPLQLPHYATPTFTDFLWTILLSLAMAVATFLILRSAKEIRTIVTGHEFTRMPVAAIAVAFVAIAFAEISGEPSTAVLFSGQDEMVSVLQQAGTLSLGTLALLLVCKAVAWSMSLGFARGGPTFPAIFLGMLAGILAAHLPGFSETPAVAVLIGAAVVSVLRLPLSAIVLALLITQGGAGVAPLVIVGVAVAYLGTLGITGRTARSQPVRPPGQRQPSTQPANVS
jgi:H+/Cl- antiporter ClcA